MSDIVDRLRGKYACGPHMPNGNPEFGWRQFQAPPIQHEAADEIEATRANLKAMADAVEIQKAEIERLRASLEEIEMASFPLERESVRVLCVPIGAWDNAMRALESK